LPLNQARGFIQPRLRKYARTAIVVELADAVLLREELIRLDQVDGGDATDVTGALMTIGDH
jgi:hypothetical protein